MKHFDQGKYAEILITVQELSQQAINYNACQSGTVVNHGSFIPEKYSLTYLITQYLQENNHFLHDL